ncbi:uncharacterized protein MELLADRAFT_105487 [Melampsora larici-populina 98AG31]|uniref:Uncharacterized protein n=1 Tax=Melampsora larici-populina (strain 98AG31 / pathotype 3-4-7) TaxID=747676 RepID=F4RIB0_MELLP|nr:uncharacterized protein MELLADRAFT_105487 [Melampsora larici-populina 98AG31]EGG07996.1 hypothetical protein MELLADRAFT_105487 [Melampsora larici-populina 98AG31]
MSQFTHAGGRVDNNLAIVFPWIIQDVWYVIELTILLAIMFAKASWCGICHGMRMSAAHWLAVLPGARNQDARCQVVVLHFFGATRKVPKCKIDDKVVYSLYRDTSSS